MGPVAAVRDAMEFIETSEIDAAILDIRLGDYVARPEEAEIEASFRRQTTYWRWLVRALGLVLFALGAIILINPAVAAFLFAAPALGTADSIFLRAIAARDLTIGITLLAAPAISLPATTLLLFAIAIIPAIDLLLVISHNGLTPTFLPHAVSLAVILILALWGKRLA